MTRVEVGSNCPDSMQVDHDVSLHPANAKMNFMRSHRSDDLRKRNSRGVETQTGTAPDYLRLPTPPSRMTILSFNLEMPNKSDFARAIILVNSTRTFEPGVQGDLT